MGLNMIVAVKWVPNTQIVNIDPTTGTLIREGIPSIVNPHDLNAVELALRLKEKYGGTVTAISMAPPAARAGLEFIMGMGVDRAILITDKVFAGADTLATSYTLAKAIEKLKPYDLLIFGHETIDSSTAHIGAQVASWLKIPYIYYVIDTYSLREDWRRR
ncbi:MAG: electron transfer flavoprotein subunit beta/FixA family protein [Nitrososphaerota archaeon]